MNVARNSETDPFRARHTRLDLLINNAGILSYTAKTNSAGVELQFATNHLGHFLLTALVLDMMPDSPASRVVSLSSVAHKGARIHFDDLTCGGNGGTAYGQSKLACLMFGEDLDRRLRAARRQIKSIPVHPGGSDSGLFDEMGRAQCLLLKVLSPFIRACFDNMIEVYPVGDPRNREDDSPAAQSEYLPQLPQLPQQHSLARKVLINQEDAFEERAAIIEYDGGLPRALAEFLAGRWCKPTPRDG